MRESQTQPRWAPPPDDITPPSAPREPTPDSLADRPSRTVPLPPSGMSHNERRLAAHAQPAPAPPPEYGVALPRSQVPQSHPAEDLAAAPQGQGVVGSATSILAGAMPDPIGLTFEERWAVHASDSQFNALAGAIGGFTSGIVTCPLDVIKTKLQAQGGFAAAQAAQGTRRPRVYKGLVGTARVIWKHEGLRGMYRGLGPIIMGYLPTWAVWFTVYNRTKTFLGEYHSRCWTCPGSGKKDGCWNADEDTAQKTALSSTSGRPS